MPCSMFDGLTMRDLAKLRPAVFAARLSEHDIGMHALPAPYCPSCYYPGRDGLHNPATGALPVVMGIYACLRH